MSHVHGQSQKGTKAPQAAGKIHTDFERGFIRAEVVSYDNLISMWNDTAAKEKGLVRLEGKDYVVQDGDVCCSALMYNRYREYAKNRLDSLFSNWKTVTGIRDN